MSETTNPLKPIAPPATTHGITTPPTVAAPAGDSEAGKAYMAKMIGIIKQVSPNSTQTECAQFVPPLLRAMCAASLTSKNQLIAMVATVDVENGAFRSIEEYATGDDYEPRTDLGNNQPGDGRKFKGRGYIQITGRTNYTAISKQFNVDLLSDPTKLLKDTELAAKSACWWWKGATGNNPSKPAQSGDWTGVRVAVNGGTNGMDKFMAAINRGVKFITEDLNAALIGVAPASGDYGLGCLDAGSGQTRMVTGGGAASSQADVLARALGLHLLDRHKAIMFHGLINCAEYPELVDLSPQKTFELQNFGEGLNGTLTVDQVKFYCGKNLEMEIWAYMPDPNAPAPQIFRNSSDQPLNGNNGFSAPIGPLPPGSLAVPMHYQVDNPEEGHRVCNTYSCYMAGKFLGMNCPDPVTYYRRMKTFGDSTSHDVQTRTLASFGMKSSYATNLDFKDLDSQLAKRKPIVIGIAHRGSEASPTGGHVLCVIGRTASGDYVVNDPYGDLNTGYANNRDGAGKVYKRSSLMRRWYESGPGTGQGRIF